MARLALGHAVVFLLAGGMGTSAMAQGDGDLWRGEALAAPCFACHGQREVEGGIPSLDEPDEVGEELREFRTGAEEATIMGRIATGYSDEEIRLLDRYFRYLAGGEHR